MDSISNDELAVPKGSLILVTGATGMIGSHVVNEALKAGYRVRGTTRSQYRAKYTTEVFQHHSNFSTAIVGDVTIPGAWDAAMKDVSAVVHLASDVSFNPDPNVVVKPTEEGVRNILRSAKTAGSVKRFVLTSSSSAVLIPHPNKEITVGVDDWDQEALDEAWKPPPYTPERAFFTYAASKVAGEKALWDFMKTDRPNFVANAVLPNLNLGTILTAGGPTGSSVQSLLKGEIPAFPPQYHIDVIDDARIHIIAAVLDPSIKNERIFAFARPFTFTEMIEILKELRPDAKSLPSPPSDEGQDLSKVPNELGRQLLKKWYGQGDYKTMRQSIEECLASLNL